MKTTYWAEIKLLLLLSLPLIAGQLAQTGMGVVDTMMAGAVSKQDLAGVALGTAVWMPTFLFMTGVLLALTPKIAQAVGRKEHQSAVSTLRQGVWLGLLLTIPTVLILLSVPWWIGFFALEAKVEQVAIDYLVALAWGALPAMLFQVIRFFHEAHGLTKITMYLSIVGFLLNIPLNLLFVYGAGPIPAMGGVGCGVATSLVYMVMAVVGWWMYRRHALYAVYRSQTLPADTATAPRRLFAISLPNVPILMTLLAIGVPIGWAILFEVGLFTFIAFLVAPLGTDPLAAHQVAISFTGIAFMLPLSFAMALTIRVGQLVGSGDVQRLQLAIKTALWLSVVIGVLVALTTWLLASWIVGLYTQDAIVASIAVTLLWIAALYQVSDAIQVVSAGALRGIGDTQAVMWITLVSYWGIGLPTGYYLCYGAWNSSSGSWLGVNGFWISLVIGLTVAAIGLLWRLRRQFFSSRAILSR